MAASPYNLFLDVQTVQTKDFQDRGIPRYVCGHALALVQTGEVCGLGLNPLEQSPTNLDPALATSPLLTWTTASKLRRHNQRPFAYHIMSPFETVPRATILPPFLEPETPVVVTLYDLIPLLDPETYLARADSKQHYHSCLELIKGADLVLAISENTRSDALRLLDLDPNRVVSIGAGVSGYFRPALSGEYPERLVNKALPEITCPFVLCVAGADKRKNVDGLIDAWGQLPSSLREEFQLVVTCHVNDEWRQRWRDRAATCGLQPQNLVITDIVTDQVLLALYQTARLKVFPSLYEGFGLPAAEAAACGCPTITSNTSSMPEILDSAEATFDPHNPESMAEKIQRALTDDGFCTSLRTTALQAAATHRWDAVAERTLEALTRLPAPTAAGSRKPSRRRVALVGPLPPIRSGIADYNRRVATELGKLCELDLLGTEGSDLNPNPAIPGVRTISLGELGETLNPGAYDLIIYTFGNSDHHHLTLDKACKYPGVIWFHDVRLSGFYISYGASRVGAPGISRFMADKLDYFYRNRLPAELVATPSFEMETYDHYGLGLTVELAQDARGVLVNSGFARHLLEMDQGPFMSMPTTGVIPLAVPPVPARFEVKREEMTVGTFGIGGMHKAADLLIEALALVRQRIPARLVFVGPCETVFRLKLERLVADQGLFGAVEFTGELDEATYWDWLGRVTCAVQVRSSTHGESSAALNDCLAAGVPAVTNLISCRELPHGVVDQMDADFSPAELAERLELLLTNGDLRAAYTQAGHQWASQNSFARVAQSLLDYLEVLDPVAL